MLFAWLASLAMREASRRSSSRRLRSVLSKSVDLLAAYVPSLSLMAVPLSIAGKMVPSFFTKSISRSVTQPLCMNMGKLSLNVV